MKTLLTVQTYTPMTYNNGRATYVNFCDVFFIFWHVVPLHSCLCFDLLPPHTGDASQHHVFPQDCFCLRWDVDTYWLAQVDWRSMEMLHTASLKKAQSKCSSSINSKICLTWMFDLHFVE